MKILITGAAGFLGKEFTRYYTQEHEVISLSRNELDVSIESQVIDFFNNNDIDVILHTAFVGGKRGREDDFFDFCQNIAAYRNLILHKDKSTLLFCFGSGAAYDRERPIRNVLEEELGVCYPKDHYGKAKNIISSHIETTWASNTYDFRLFGCFGREETDARFIKNVLHQRALGKPITIHKNKLMDFFYVGDLCRTINHYVQHKDTNLPITLNMVYEKKYTLSEMATHLCGKTYPLTVYEEGLDFYTGDGSKLASLSIPLVGMFTGIEKANYNV